MGDTPYFLPRPQSIYDWRVYRVAIFFPSPSVWSLRFILATLLFTVASFFFSVIFRLCFVLGKGRTAAMLLLHRGRLLPGLFLTSLHAPPNALPGCASFCSRESQLYDCLHISVFNGRVACTV